MKLLCLDRESPVVIDGRPQFLSVNFILAQHSTQPDDQSNSVRPRPFDVSVSAMPDLDLDAFIHINDEF
jgi:hypothetical protein